MIFYFSATGNSKYVATRIEGETHERAISITECMTTNQLSFNINSTERIGIISLTYGWVLPSIVREFLSLLRLRGYKENYAFFVATYGTTSGQTGEYASQLLEKKDIHLNAKFSVKMPDTWTPIYDLSNKEKVNEINTKAESEIHDVIHLIKNRSAGDFMKNKVPYTASLFYGLVYEHCMRKTNKFSVDENCISCGLCAKKCPVKAIELQNGKPVWVQDKCVMCLGCLHGCPKFSIQHGKNTKKHGQYKNPNVRI